MVRINHTKEYIFDQAVRLFSEKGYEATTIRNISSAVGVNEATIYHHFKNKADILAEILRVFDRKLKKITERQIDRFIETDTPRQLLERFLHKYSGKDAEFMKRAYRIVYMEQFTNEKAREIVVNVLHVETEKSIKYALDKLIELEKIPFFDTRLFAALWAQLIFAEGVISAGHFFDERAALVGPEGSSVLGTFMIESAVNGKFPSHVICAGL